MKLTIKALLVSFLLLGQSVEAQVQNFKPTSAWNPQINETGRYLNEQKSKEEAESIRKNYQESLRLERQRIQNEIEYRKRQQRCKYFYKLHLPCK